MNHNQQYNQYTGLSPNSLSSSLKPDPARPLELFLSHTITRRTLMQIQDTEYEAARAIDRARNDQQEAEAALLASADFRHPVNHALVRSARIARLSRDS